MHITESPTEKCVLVGIDIEASEWGIEESLKELALLASTAGAEPVAVLTQKLRSPSPKTYIGSGKVMELKQLCYELNADLVIFDNELSPTQQSNIERLLDMKFKIIDRTALILDIFGQHAKTHEGKLQVQMAQLQYLYPRLRGMWSHLAKDRTRGGIGSRFGQGESQLEVDRRLIRNRISTLKRELKTISQVRDMQRKNRYDSHVFKVSIAGYTNAGKSTLLNCLTDSDVYVQNQLFATLDPTTRNIVLEGGREAVLTDTVGFIQKLPHGLVESFKSTLSEIANSDLIIKLVDFSDPLYEEKIHAVDSVLDEINANSIPKIIVFNKADLVDQSTIESALKRYPDSIFISAIQRTGIGELLKKLSMAANSQNEITNVLLPYNLGYLHSECHKYGKILNEKYQDNGIYIEAILPEMLQNKLNDYKI